MATYAVLWREGDGPVSAGKLMLGATSLRLDTGFGRGRASSRILRYADVASIANGTPAERIGSRPTAVVERPGRERLSIASVDGLGALREILERIAVKVAGKATV